MSIKTALFSMGAICIALLPAQASAHIGRHEIELLGVSSKKSANYKGKVSDLHIESKKIQRRQRLCLPVKSTTTKIKFEARADKMTNNKSGKFSANRGADKKNRQKITEIAQKQKMVSSSNFGKRKDPISNRNTFHKGIDISRPIGTEVFSWSRGVVAQAQWQGDYGLTVDVLHPNGVKTRYAHLQQTSVRAGQQLNKGQSIGQVGTTGRTTGANLHFEVMVAGKLANPEKYITENITIVGRAKE